MIDRNRRNRIMGIEQWLATQSLGATYSARAMSCVAGAFIEIYRGHGLNCYIAARIRCTDGTTERYYTDIQPKY